MWNLISLVILAVEIVLLTSFVVGKFRNKKLNETFVFLGLVFLVNLALYLVPFFYNLACQAERNYVFDLLECITGAVKLFLGSVDTGAVSDFTLVVPSFTYTYLLGALLALLATVSATIEAFGHTISNSFRLAAALKQPCCDLVLGGGEVALHYAKSCANAVLLLGDGADKDAAVALMEKGYAVLRKGLSAEFLNSRYLNGKTRYNIVCPQEQEAYFGYLDTFIAYKKAHPQEKQLYLFVEVDEGKTETIRREIIEKSGFQECITTFSSLELMARTLVEQYPVPRFLPAEFLDDDASVKADKKINLFLLGFGELSEQIYRQSVRTNQLVKFEDGQYRVLPVCYRIYDPQEEAWSVGGTEKVLQELAQNREAYFPLPELPCQTQWNRRTPYSRATLLELNRAIRERNSFSYVVVDTGDMYRNIETGSRLRSMLEGTGSYHIFIRSDSGYIQDDERITYYGDFSQVYTHDIIVSDGLAAMAKKLNEVYARQQMKEKAEEADFEAQVAQAAADSWNAMNYFTMYSNIHAAMSLRLKLNLLGLNYVRDGKGENTGLIQEKYQRREGSYDYSEYFTRSKRNALLAQEHARWNAYHLLAEYLPMEREAITVKSAQEGKVRFNTKNVPARRHACLTTYQGLNDLSGWLAEEAGKLTDTAHDPAEYDFYVYDEMLLLSAAELMEELGYSITEL